jgi:transcriptional regulator with XRE-family HTH domain
MSTTTTHSQEVPGGVEVAGPATTTALVAPKINAARISGIAKSAEIAQSEGGEATLQGDLFSRIQALLGQGMTQKQAAGELGVSESTVSRTLADRLDVGASGPAQSAVDLFVVSLGASLPPDVAARVEALRALAAKLDWTRRATTGTAAMAASSLAKEFRSLLDELQQSTSFDELREALLAGADD